MTRARSVAGSVTQAWIMATLVLSAPPAVAAERGYSTTDFDRISVEGSYAVTVETGKAPSARASGTPDSLEQVTIEVVGRTLRIKPNRNAWGGALAKPAKAATVKVTTRTIQLAALGGSGSLSITKIKGAKIILSLGGSGTMSVGAIEADRLDSDLAGAGTMTLAGTVLLLNAKGSGAANYDAEKLSVKDATVTWLGSGNGTLAVSRTAKVTATGVGNFTIIGKPACTVNAVGSGVVTCGPSDQR